MPLFWWNLSFRDKEKINMFKGGWVGSILLGLLFGIIYFVLLRRFNFENINFTGDLIGVAIATSIVEELTFSGFIAGYLEKINKGKLINLAIVSGMMTLLRLPILFFVYKVSMLQIIGVLLLVFFTGVINVWIRIRTGNVTGSIIARIGLNLASLI